MKSFIVAIVVAALLVGGSVGYSIYIDRVTKEINDGTKKVEDAVRADDFVRAKEELSDVEGIIEKESTLLGSIVEHKEMFEIKRNIYEIGVFLESKNKEESLSRLKAIYTVSEQLSGNTALKISNIL